jgi:hypothetical protein
LELVKLCLNKGADVNAEANTGLIAMKAFDYYGATTLLEAAHIISK